MFVSMIEMINRNQKSNTNEIKKKQITLPQVTSTSIKFDFN